MAVSLLALEKMPSQASLGREEDCKRHSQALVMRYKTEQSCEGMLEKDELDQGA